MGSDVAKLPSQNFEVKVHNLMCTELVKVVDRISKIFPDIESAQPKCSLGIEALCSLNVAMEKNKLLIQHCTESSKLYLAVTGDAIKKRCERVKNAMEQSLREIQTMVPVLLAAQISAIADDLKDMKFIMETCEKEAGNALLALFRLGADTAEASEFNAFRTAALKLHITSSKELLIEKRSIEKLLNKVCDIDQRKERILKYILYLVRKYGKTIICEKTTIARIHTKDLAPDVDPLDQDAKQKPYLEFFGNEVQTDNCSKPMPPEEFKCPISTRLMYDPVVIASGETFERFWIEKWFNEGQDTCPRTQQKLSHVSATPNTAMKDLISKWSRKYGVTVADPCAKGTPAALHRCKTLSTNSIASFGSSLKDMPLKNDYHSVSFGSSIVSLNSSHSKILAGLNEDSPREDDSQTFQLSGRNNPDSDADFLSKLDELPWELQCKLLEDFKQNLEGKGTHSILSTRSFKALVRFSKDACDRCDVLALRVGAQVLLMFVSKSRNEIQSLCEEAFHLLVIFLDSEITEEALAITQVLSGDPDCQSELVAAGVLPPIIGILDSPLRKFQAASVKILNDLSSNSKVDSEIIRLGCVPKLIQLLSDRLVSKLSVQILKNLCKTEEGRVAIAETKGSIASVAELLESGNHEEQEHGVDVLLSLCSHNVKYCHLVLNEGIIPSLVTISVNGNDRAKEIALQLLRHLRDTAYNDHQENSVTIDVSPNPELPQDPDNCFVEKKSPSKPAKSFMKRTKKFLKQRLSLDLC